MFEKQSILKEFPNVKLSYENIIHKKVYNSDLILAVPSGKKCFMWFTMHNNKPVCYSMELNNNEKQISDINKVVACYDYSLCYGTIFYGTAFIVKGYKFYCIEDVFYYKGKSVERENWQSKFNLLGKIFETELKQTVYNKNFVVFGLPIIANDWEEFETKIKTLTYKLYAIQYLKLNHVSTKLCISYDAFSRTARLVQNNVQGTSYTANTSNTANKKICTFLVKPDIQNDIYHLYSQSNNNVYDAYVGIACIPTYTTSVMMNGLFRIIKENDNLDRLEESDDEDEFENERIDRFVNLEKEFLMECQFNNKFKKWIPLRAK